MLAHTLSAVVALLAASPDTARRAHTAADTRFMQGMIGHHAQALAMAALVPARTSRGAFRLMGERIDVSQRDEIAMMTSWLTERGEAVPAWDGGHAHHHEGHEAALMPGMLTPDEMAALAADSGASFERRFLEGMIRHHEGAITMVRALLATPGAAQAPEVFRFAKDVASDQGAEIRRMRALLASLPDR